MTVEVDVLARAESVAMLRARMPGLPEAEADLLADQLGDLPLAVAQAAGYLPGSGLSVAAYLELLRTRAVEILDLGKPVSYPQSLAAATRLSFDQLSGEDLAAAQLISVCAFLAPEPIPQDLFITVPAQLPEPLAGARLTRWRGRRCWPGSPAGPWPASIRTDCSCTGSPRPLCVTTSPPPRPLLPGPVLRRSWPHAAPEPPTIPSPGPAGPS